MQEMLDIALFGACDGTVGTPKNFKPRLDGPTPDPFDGSSPRDGVTDHAPSGHILSSSLKLWFDQHDGLSIGPKQALYSGKNQREADERKVTHNQVDGLGKGLEISGICALHHDDSRVFSKSVMQQLGTHINRVHTLCTPLQKNLGEAARTASQIRADGSLAVDGRKGL